MEDVKNSSFYSNIIETKMNSLAHATGVQDEFSLNIFRMNLKTIYLKSSCTPTS